MKSIKVMILSIMSIVCIFSFLNTSTRDRFKCKPKISITIDDPNTHKTPMMDWETRNEKIRKALRNHNLRAVLFVCGSKVKDKKGFKLLETWDEEGHLLGNHSFSHLNFNSNKVSLEEFKRDLAKCDSLINQFTNHKRLFRFPFLKEGNTQEKRDGFREFLKGNDYEIGHVSIDASDWYIDQRLLKRLKKDQDVDITPYREYYLQHIFDRAIYYDELAKDLLGKQVKHTLLIHHNLLNALFLEDLITMFKQKGWELINASEAYKDELYDQFPDMIPAGESIIWALAKQSGEYDSTLRYPGEDGKYEKDRMDKLKL